MRQLRHLRRFRRPILKVSQESQVSQGQNRISALRSLQTVANVASVARHELKSQLEPKLGSKGQVWLRTTRAMWFGHSPLRQSRQLRHFPTKRLQVSQESQLSQTPNWISAHRAVQLSQTSQVLQAANSNHDL